MDQERQQLAPLLLGLRTHPLAITLFSPSEGRHYIAPLTPAAGQALALALLSQVGVGGDVLPAVLEQYLESRAATAAKDAQLMEEMGVTYAAG